MGFNSKRSNKIRFSIRKSIRQKYGVKYLLYILILILIFKCFHHYRKDEKDTGPPPYSEQYLSTDLQHPFYESCVNTQEYLEDESYKKMNATFVMLTRNEELDDVVHTINSIESHFNQWFRYPYVFLNNVPFTEAFKEKIKSITTSEVEFGLINELDWNFPAKVKQSPLFRESLIDQSDRGIMYGSMESYHQMCRFYSGLFYKHPLVRKFEWYWRLEPDVDFFCDISYDPFYEMSLAGKKYGFTVLIPEIYWSVPNLFRYTQSFIKENKGLKLGSIWKLFTYNLNIMKTDNKEIQEWVHLQDDLEPKLREKILIDLYQDGELDGTPYEEDVLDVIITKAKSKKPLFEDKFNNQEYNLCHFWSNFEIAKISVFDNDIYDSYFKYLEENEGFWRERWGDAPVHSLGLALTLDFEEVHYFRDIGYRHSILSHCPKNSYDNLSPYQENDIKYRRKGISSMYDKGTDYGIGCRCKCPWNTADVEDFAFPCMDIWFEMAHEVHFETNFDGEYHPSIDVSEVETQLREKIMEELQI